MAKKKVEKISETLAIVCLILNIIVLPGLGSLIGKRKHEGIWQLVLFLAGIPLAIIIIGVPIMLAAWIWGIVTGVEIIEGSEKHK